MRKRKKMKKHSCPMCKAYKMGGACRWSPRELDTLKRTEKEILDIMKGA